MTVEWMSLTILWGCKMYDPFYWYERDLDQEYLKKFGEVQCTNDFIETEMINEFSDKERR